METVLKAVCDKAFTTKETGNLNLIGIFENIYTDNFPARHPEFFAVFFIEADPRDGMSYSYYFDIENPSGEKIIDMKSQPQELKIGINGKVNLIIKVMDTTFQKEGLYNLNLHIGDKFKEAISIRVISKGT